MVALQVSYVTTTDELDAAAVEALWAAAGLLPHAPQLPQQLPPTRRLADSPPPLQQQRELVQHAAVAGQQQQQWRQPQQPRDQRHKVGIALQHSYAVHAQQPLFRLHVPDSLSCRLHIARHAWPATLRCPPTMQQCANKSAPRGYGQTVAAVAYRPGSGSSGDAAGRSQPELIGLARCVTDGQFVAVVADVAVLPPWQARRPIAAALERTLAGAHLWEAGVSLMPCGASRPGTGNRPPAGAAPGARSSARRRKAGRQRWAGRVCGLPAA